MQKLYLIFFLVVLAFTGSAQDIKEFGGDLKSAKKIQVNNKYEFPVSPVGYGNVKEYKIDPKRSANLFKEERNTAWYVIEMPYEGIFTFDLTPHGIKDDYDWMLFNYKGAGLNDVVIDVPLRTNNARNNKAQGSTTGLKDGSDHIFARPGPGNSYSKPVDVKKGEKLLLVVDNIYKNGKGFDLQLNLKPSFNSKTVVEGIVRDKKTNKPLKAEVTFEDDSTGFVFAKLTSDASGYFKTKLPANRQINSLTKRLGYLLVTDNFKVIPSDTAIKLNYYLDTIVQGKKMDLMNIHFFPNKAEFLASSQPELEHLLAFLMEQPDWQIRIVGHTNANVFANTRYLQQLSFDRAVAVKKYLLQNSIAEQRISCIGQGGKNPIVRSNDPEEGKKNMRVEVVLTRKQ